MWNRSLEMMWELYGWCKMVKTGFVEDYCREPLFGNVQVFKNLRNSLHVGKNLINDEKEKKKR